MSSAATPDPFDIQAILAGAEAPLTELLLLHPAESLRLPDDFYAGWRQRSLLHDDVVAACRPLFVELRQLDVARWAADPAHSVWRVLRCVQIGAAGYQPELGRAGEKLLADLTGAVGQVRSGGWSAVADALEKWWSQEQQRLNRLEQRLIDTELGQLRSRRAQQVAARLLNQTMAGRRFAREIVDYLHGEWFQELQWALLQFGVDSEQWRRRAQLTERLVESLQPPEEGDDDARQQLYALIPEVGAELAALLGERAHDRSLLDRQLATIEAQHIQLLRGNTTPAADFQLIANDDPWLSSTTVSASLLQRVAALEPGDWFVLRDVDEGLRVKLALKLDDIAQLLFVNRLGVKVQQKSFEEFAYQLSVGAAVRLPDPDCARNALRALLADMARRSLAEREDAAARQQAEHEARLRNEAKAKAIAEARALAEAQARAEAEQVALREAAEREALAEARRVEQERERQLQEEQQRAQEQRGLEERVQAEALHRRQLEEEQRLLQERRRNEEREREEQAPRRAPEAACAPRQVDAVAVPDEQRLRAARREAGLLPIGSWLELRAADGTFKRLKVAVKLPSSGKLILVDRDGVRQAELDRDALALLLCDGAARLLNQGPRFEDTLAKVVDSMRRDRAPKE